MQNPLETKANVEYFETTGDGSKCIGCEEMIMGKMFQVVIFIMNEPIYSKFKYCEDCYILDNDK